MVMGRPIGKLLCRGFQRTIAGKRFCSAPGHEHALCGALVLPDECFQSCIQQRQTRTMNNIVLTELVSYQCWQFQRTDKPLRLECACECLPHILIGYKRARYDNT